MKRWTLRDFRMEDRPGVCFGFSLLVSRRDFAKVIRVSWHHAPFERRVETQRWFPQYNQTRPSPPQNEQGGVGCLLDEPSKTHGRVWLGPSWRVLSPLYPKTLVKWTNFRGLLSVNRKVPQTCLDKRLVFVGQSWKKNVSNKINSWSRNKISRKYPKQRFHNDFKLVYRFWPVPRSWEPV